jgi:hypothetical protein
VAVGAGDRPQRAARRAPLAAPHRPNPLTTAEQVRSALETTGWALQQLEAVRAVRRMQNIEDLAGLLGERDPIADRSQDLTDADRRPELLHEVADRLEAYRRAGGLALPGLARCAIAVKRR